MLELNAKNIKDLAAYGISGDDIKTLVEQNTHSEMIAKQSELDTLKENNRHDEVLDAKCKDNEHEEKLTNKKIGILGIIFGDENHASRNITALICVLFIIMSWIILFADSINDENTIIIREVIFPIITLSLGYLFGKSSNKS